MTNDAGTPRTRSGLAYARDWILQTFCHSVRIQFDAPWNSRRAQGC